VSEPVVHGAFDERALFLTAALASKPENKDPIELPIFAYIEAHFADLDWRSYRQAAFKPFDPVRKRTEAQIEKGDEHFVAMKGAPQILLAMADLPEEDRHALDQRIDELAGRGFRTLAVGRQRAGAAFELVGLIPFYDPPREESKQVIADMRAHGLTVKMVTGDNMAIAREIAGVLGLKRRTMSSAQLSGAAGSEILQLAEVLAGAIYQRLKVDVSLKDARKFADDVMNSVAKTFDTRLLEREFLHTHESAIVDLIENVDIFAEVVPEDKYKIVDSLQKAGHIVGMTGDGVNDAPALDKADCGIAVANATDAARAAAAVVLTAPGLGVINEAVKLARITFERMKSYATFRIAETIRIILFMTLSIIVFDFYPITALMIILLALLNDIPILAIAYDNTRADRLPVRWDMQTLLTVSTVLGVMGVVASFVLFFVLRELGFDEETIRTLLFLKLIVAGHSTLYVTRQEGWFWQRPWPSPLLIGATFGTEVLGTLIAVYGWFVAPIGWASALAIWAYALVWFLINDAVKLLTHRLLGTRNHEPAVAA
jgi:H+-transporting ATPase